MEPAAVGHLSVLIHSGHWWRSQRGASTVHIGIARNIVRQPTRARTIGVAGGITTVSRAGWYTPRPRTVGQVRTVDHFETKRSFAVAAEQKCPRALSDRVPTIQRNSIRGAFVVKRFQPPSGSGSALRQHALQVRRNPVVSQILREETNRTVRAIQIQRGPLHRSSWQRIHHGNQTLVQLAGQSGWSGDGSTSAEEQAFCQRTHRLGQFFTGGHDLVWRKQESHSSNRTKFKGPRWRAKIVPRPIRRNPACQIKVVRWYRGIQRSVGSQHVDRGIERESGQHGAHSFCGFGILIAIGRQHELTEAVNVQTHQEVVFGFEQGTKCCGVRLAERAQSSISFV